MNMRGRERVVETNIDKSYWWLKWLIALVLTLICVGIGVAEWRISQVVGHSQYRFNLALITPEDGVVFVSIDPAEKSILALPFPTNLAITSRTSGEYVVSSLYKLGSYQDQKGGMFARQKIQGFMRVPVPGYVVVGKSQKTIKSSLNSAMRQVVVGQAESSLSKLDAVTVLLRSNDYKWREVSEEELVRVAVLERKEKGFVYHPDRLQEYVGTRLFDWGIGASGTTVAILNASGVNGLGSDMADFLTNLGMDVVMVRSVAQSESSSKTEWQVNSLDEEGKLQFIFENLFSLDKPKVEKIPDEYRSQVLIKVGTDAKDLF